MKTRFALATALALALAAPAQAAQLLDQNGQPADETADVSRQSHAHVQCTLTVTATATLLSSLWSTAGCGTMYTKAQLAFIQPTGGTVWYRTDGTAPTTSTGMQIPSGMPGWPIEGSLSINAMQMISASGGSVAVNAEIRY